MNIARSLAIACLGVALPAIAGTGILPVPTFTSVSVTSTVTFDAVNVCYDYNYTFTNPSTNTGVIEDMTFDVSTPYLYYDPGTCQAPMNTPRGTDGVDFNPNFDIPLNLGHQGHILTFGEAVPTGWFETVDGSGQGGFAATGPAYGINPGQTLAGFQMQTSTPPTVKTMYVEPHWMLETNGEAAPQDFVDAAQVDKQLMLQTQVLAPSSVVPGTEDHWNEFKTDIQTLISIGWISDSTFGSTVASQLAAARTINDSQGSAYVTPALTTLLNTITASTSSQRNVAAYELLLLNTQALIAWAVPPNSVPPAPLSVPKALIISADQQTLALNTSVTVTAQIVDTANNNAPMPNQYASLFISGVNSAQSNGQTDANGKFSLTYTGSNQGVDTVYLHTGGELDSDAITVNWKGGPDLTIKYFVPPVIQWQGSGTIHFTEDTENIGNAPATPSITRYYVSSTSPVDQATAEVVGQRSVGTLAPGADSDNGGIDLPLPSDLAPGTYYLEACADADNTVAETNEMNNCQSNTIAMAVHVPYQPPVCTAASPSANMLWPPNHKMVDITINGVTDPNNLTPTITITGIQQDEPVNSDGDGNTQPDGAGVGTSTAQVRSERSGIAQDGRLYFIAFSATDTDGGSCTGSVTVGVPHDKGQNSMPVDNGQRYDSTVAQ